MVELVGSLGSYFMGKEAQAQRGQGPVPSHIALRAETHP